MIDASVFITEIAILADRYGREIKAPTIAAMYDVLSEELSTEQFVIGCRRVLKRETFFPTPAAIIAAGQPAAESPESVAATLFEQIRDRAIAWGKNPAAVAAVRQAGGESLVMADDPRVVSFARRDFIAAYVGLLKRGDDAAEIAALLPHARRAIATARGMTPIADTLKLVSPPRANAK